MKIRKVLWIFFLGIFLNGNAQNLYDYYENLWSRDNIVISDIQKEVDSILKVTQNKGQHLDQIKIAHRFSVKLFKEKLYENAIKYAKYEISVYDKIGLKNDKYAKALYNLGYFYYRFGHFRKSIPYYEKVISIDLDEFSSARAFCEIGYYFYLRGDYYKSADYYAYGITSLESLNKNKLLIKKYINYSHVLFEIETESSLDKMLEVLDNANNLFSLVPNYSSSDFNNLNNDYANYYSTKQRLDLNKVRYYCYRNLNIAIQDKDSTYIYSAYTNLGKLYTKINVDKQKDSALFYLNKALDYTRNSREKSIVLHNQSNYYLKNSKYQEALETIQQALIQSTGLDPDIEALPNLDGLKVSDNKYNILLALAQKSTILIKLYQKKGNQSDLEFALANLLSADKLIDILIGVSKEDGSRLYWRKEAAEIYLKAILVCKILNNKEKAFYFSEKKKALLLTDDILNNTEKLQLPDTLLKQENQFKKQIFDLENRISNEKRKDSSKLLESKRFELKQQYQSFEDSLHFLFPNYSKRNRIATRIMDVQSVQKKLNKQNVVISYSSNTDTNDESFNLLYAVLISNTQTEIIKIGELKPIEKLIKIYRQQLSRAFETKEERAAFQETASKLYDILIPKDKISIALDKQHLIIIPDGKLQYIPFESLIVDQHTNRYLIEDNEVSYAYSMSFLHHNTSINRRYSRDLVSFAPLHFEHSNLEDITNSINEINDIDAYISSDIYKENEASKQNFLTKTKGHKIIHLATHANYSDNLQIAFHDTNLEYHELYTSRNHAELVVLSACNTSLGELAKGEGVMSLARGFFYAGANTVISSLWNANDKSTAEIMENFYSNLNKGQTKSKALHNAKIDYLQSATLSDASPHYWATFILIGDAETNLFSSNLFFYGMIFFFFFVLIISYLIFFKKKR